MVIYTMDELYNYVHIINETKNDSNSLKKYFHLLSQAAATTDTFKEIIAPKLILLINNKIIAKDILYLSLLPNRSLLQELIDCEKSSFAINLHHHISYFDYTLFRNSHWFFEIIKHDKSPANTDSFKADIVTLLYFLQLMYLSNHVSIDLTKIDNYMSLMQTKSNSFTTFYVTKLKTILDTVQLCEKFINTKLHNNASLIYNYASKRSLLETFSKFLNFESQEACAAILEKLKTNENEVEYNLFKAFYILFNILYCIKMCKHVCNDASLRNDNISNIIEQTHSNLINLNDSNLQIKVLENIFALMFLKTEYFVKSTNTSSEFFCSENEVRLLLMFLKSTCDELKRRNPYDKTSNDFKLFTELNRHLADGLWRLELLADTYQSTHNQTKIGINIITYMLGTPESLIHLCLKKNNFAKADQVIQIFNLEDSNIAAEISYNTKLLKLKQVLKKVFKIPQFQKLNPHVHARSSFQTPNILLNEFFELNGFTENEFYASIIEKNHSLAQYSQENAKFLNIFDLAITQGSNFEECEELLNIAASCNSSFLENDTGYSKFCKTILKYFSEINNEDSVSVIEYLCNSKFELCIEKSQTKKKLYSELCNIFDIFNKQINEDHNGKFNKKHISHKTFLKLQEISATFPIPVAHEDQIKILQRLFNYFKYYSKIFYIDNDNSDIISKGKSTSYFKIFNLDSSEILRKLLERKLDVADFENLFSKLKLDLVYHVATIFFPKLNLHIQDEVEQCIFKKPGFLPNQNIISYIQKRNWLLAFILSEMYQINEIKLDLNEIRIRTFIHFLHLPRIKHLQALFNDNEVVATLQEQIAAQYINEYFDKHIIKRELDEVTLQNMLHSEVSSGSLETGEEMFEGALQITNWKHLFDIINSVPQIYLHNSKELVNMYNTVLNELVTECFEPNFFEYVKFISDDDLRQKCIVNNLMTWPVDFCIEIIRAELSRFHTNDGDSRSTLTEWLYKIELCEGIKTVFQKNSWLEVFSLCRDNPQETLGNLLNTVEINLLLQFLTIYKVDKESVQMIDESYFVALFDSNTAIVKIQNLLDILPINQTYSICNNLLKVLKKLDHLSFVSNYISKCNIHNNNSLFKSIQISLKMLSCFNQNELEQLWCLITEPASIIEVLIMNTKLEKLGQVLENIKSDIGNCEFDEDQLSIEKIDEMLRKYAEKSLEFRVVLQPEVRLLQAPDSNKLLQSLDSINFLSGKKYFVMPEKIPHKSEWIQNYEVTECMCCQETIFSMFNRRHHCRRCGRVICSTCSLKRIRVPMYGNIQVRVCIDCYEQSHQDSVGTSSSKSETSTKSVSCDYWILTNDSNHNQIVREEFSFEYAPSVSLCLAILKYHSKNEEYPKFLLDQCDVMLQLLHPTNSEAIQEIDYLLVIKMLKSLAIAAKMLSAQCMLQWGTSLADRILSQADLLGLLAERSCLHLIPACTQTPSRYIDAATLRRLRDKLLEKELWHLALEVSTKAGLDNSGVFAAWGKSFLKAGSLQLAREKFQRCFDKTAFYDTSTELSDSFSSIHLPPLRQNLLMVAENRPTKNPPLLNEIIHILESNTCVIDSKILNEVKYINPLTSSTWSLSSSVNTAQSDPAVTILNKLKNLDNISVGNYCIISDSNDSIKSLNIVKPHLESIFYNECVYYLTKFGTHLSLLEFYIKHLDVYQSLKYMLENHLHSDIFIEIYMLCLKQNLVTILQENMSEIDSTLDIWKDYLKHICRHLEKQSNLHSLYQLQQFMGDFVRAAMTCIKFYKDGAISYTELTSRVDYLHKAQQHLQQELEQEQWVEVATVRKSSMDSQDSYEAKGIVNPSLVMKMDSKNVDKHINTIWRQIEISKFLANCESSGMPVLDILPEILPFINEDSLVDDVNKLKIPTLFGSYYERVQLTVLAIVCGNNVEDGFGIAFRIIRDYKLNAVKVYCQAGKQLAKQERYSAIAQLVNCIRSSGISDSAVTDMCDEMLILAVQTLTKANITGPELDGLIKLITDRAAKISAYIETKQLKSAYLLAVKHQRIGDIRRILREAEFLNQPHIKALCKKLLLVHSHSKD